MRHTPPPWTVQPVHPYEIEDGTVIVDWDAEPQLWAIWHRYRDEQNRRVSQPIADVGLISTRRDECQANAHLIAAAPELLEGGKIALGIVESMVASGQLALRGHLGRDIANLREAIAKATGQ